ncbi:hypothetical protein SESBI_13099 [Sesbania bispinosa]|nr:hypothetical protein SESBI_13099 [Sesbania bispinosa]
MARRRQRLSHGRARNDGVVWVPVTDGVGRGEGRFMEVRDGVGHRVYEQKRRQVKRRRESVREVCGSCF